MIWGLFALTLTVWLAAIFYIVKGWSGLAETELSEMAIEGVDKIKSQQKGPLLSVGTAPLEEKTELEEDIEDEEEIEIPEEEPEPPQVKPIIKPVSKLVQEPIEKPAEERAEKSIEKPQDLPVEKPEEKAVEKPLQKLPERPATPSQAELLKRPAAKPSIEPTLVSKKEMEVPVAQSDMTDFYRKFGKGNVVEFPAEYTDKDNIRGLSGNKISVVEFAKNCYKEIGFKCVDCLMTRELEGKAYKINIFELISHHYANTEDEFIDFFGELRENLEGKIQSLDHHPQMTLRNKRALIGRYEGLPQLVVWNDRELFLVLVKSKDDKIDKREIDFFNEYILDKGLFKAKIFRVVEKAEPKPYQPLREVKPQEKPKTERGPKIQEEPKIKSDKKGPPVIELPGPDKEPPALESPKKKVRPPMILPQPPAKEERPQVIELGEPKKARPEPQPALELSKKIKRKPFAKGEIQFMAENRGKMTNEELAGHMGRSLDSVTHKLSRMNLSRESYDWTEEKDDFLRVNLTKLTYRELGERLGTTIPSVRARCKKLEIKK